MKNILVMFGGKSPEHDISIITACQLMRNIDRSKYIVTPVYILPTGEFVTGKKLTDVNDFVNFNAAKYKPVFLLPSSPKLYTKGQKVLIKKVDCIIVATHGRNCEDGTLQGLLELSGIPYTCGGVLPMSITMDKIAAKLCLKGLLLPVTPYFWINKHTYNPKERTELTKTMKRRKMVFPLIVKPANSGSSIGIKKAADWESLNECINAAFEFDERVLVEQTVENMAEYNCSALGTSAEIIASPIEEPAGIDEILSFDDKYLRSASKSSEGMLALKRKLPAEINSVLEQKIKGYTKKIFAALDCKGVIRVDYLYDKAAKKLYVNEVNSIPGSLAFYLWENAGVKYGELIDKLIDGAIAVNSEKAGCKYTYFSSVLNNLKSGFSSAKTK